MSFAVCAVCQANRYVRKSKVSNVHTIYIEVVRRTYRTPRNLLQILSHQVVALRYVGLHIPQTYRRFVHIGPCMMYCDICVTQPVTY